MTSSQVLLLSFLPATSYQQGVLSATLLYEILLGKATLSRTVLVSALVLMAMVRRGPGWARQVG